jgi:predicted nucleotidyltransferase
MRLRSVGASLPAAPAAAILRPYRLTGILAAEPPMSTLLQHMHEQRARAREASREEAYRELRATLGRLLPPGTGIWVFGSVLKPGRFREHSDIDIAVECLPEGRSEAWLQGELELRFHRAVDVLNLRETGLRSKIERTGEYWTL